MNRKCVLAIVDPGEGLENLMGRFRSFEGTGLVDHYVNSFSFMGSAKAKYYEAMREVAVCDNLPGVTLPKNHPLAKDWRLKSVPASQFMTFQEFVEAEWTLPYKEEGEKADLYGAHKWGWLAHEDGELVDVVVRTNPRGKWQSYLPGGLFCAALREKWTGKRTYHLPLGKLDVRRMRTERRRDRKKKLEQLLKECQRAGYQREEALALWRGYTEAGGVEKLEDKYEEAGGRLHLGQDIVSWVLKQSDPELAEIKAAVVSRVAITLAGFVPEGVYDPVHWADHAPAVSCSAIVKGQDWWEDTDPLRWENTVSTLLGASERNHSLFALEVLVK